MRALLASVVLTAAFVKGVVIGTAVGAVATGCMRCALRGGRRKSREPEVEEQQKKVPGQA
jgi:hypothetical protein